MVQAFVDAFKHGAAALSVFDVREAVQLKPAVLERAGRLAPRALPPPAVGRSASGLGGSTVKSVLRASRSMPDLSRTASLGWRWGVGMMER